jgi:uncharacterized protein YjiS (DUF1127 family)
MAVASDIRFETSLLDRLAAVLSTWAEKRAKRAMYRTTLRELNHLSGRELADLGLHRSQLKSMAFEAAYGPRFM